MLATRCPCRSGNAYEECCGRFHGGAAVAPTAEALMRSRYSAYALGLADYILDSWHPSTRPTELELDPGLSWYRLDVLAARGGPFDRVGVVEFRAYYRSDGQRGDQHEVSRFVRERGRWYYVDAA
jgi:SEC-C motif-containing protein